MSFYQPVPSFISLGSVILLLLRFQDNYIVINLHLLLHFLGQCHVASVKIPTFTSLSQDLSLCSLKKQLKKTPYILACSSFSLEVVAKACDRMTGVLGAVVYCLCGLWCAVRLTAHCVFRKSVCVCVFRRTVLTVNTSLCVCVCVFRRTMLIVDISLTVHFVCLGEQCWLNISLTLCVCVCVCVWRAGMHYL